ncbi:MAG TPA: hypothetical protein VF158_12485 [Longimicrobiales bacterium]
MAKRKQRRSDTVVLAVVSDLHAGSTVGLCPDGGIDLDDGGRYEPSTAQRWLWQCWREYWDAVARAREDAKGLLYVVLNGDLVDGAHHGTTQIVSGNMDVQGAVARACLEVPRALEPDRWFVVRGTEAHVGPSAQSEEGLARHLGAEPDANTGTRSWWHLRMDVLGHRLDFAHHGRTGYRSWTRWNATQLLAADIALTHLQDGERPPDLAVRSHFHRYADSYDAQPVRVIQTPAFQLATAYVHRRAPESLADIGGIIVTLRTGHMDVRPVLYKPRRSTVWTAAA